MKRIIRKILKEEVDNRISREDYLNKILGYLVDDTIIDFGAGRIRFPFYPRLLYLTHPEDGFSSFRLLAPRYLPFSDYCKDNYGLTEDEIDYVWEEYTRIITDKMENSNSINESVDNRISREDYLNKIIGYLVDDTFIDFKENEIRYPYSLSPFSDYCKDTYGLTEDEIDYVWKEYKNIITDRVKNMGSINESVDRRSNYLNKILDILVDDTFIDFDENQIQFPFYPFPLILLPPSSSLSPPISAFRPLSPSFSEYCKDNYGLTDEEIDYVWKKYTRIITDKIENRH